MPEGAEGSRVRVATQVGTTRLILLRGDLTEQATDAIVNSASPTLLGGGGVDGAIHSTAGPELLEECKRIRERDWPAGLPTGKAVITGAGRLRARYVIHTVGPVWAGGHRGEAGALRSAYVSSLELAESKGLRSVAFPSISTGVFGFPVQEASRLAIRAIADYLSGEPPRGTLRKTPTLREVKLVLFSEADFEAYRKALEGVVPGSHGEDP